MGDGETASGTEVGNPFVPQKLHIRNFMKTHSSQAARAYTYVWHQCSVFDCLPLFEIYAKKAEND
jgi:hypothetical protein